jgi:23S rRNA (guanosine2251-2'-O)-methyltransferase
MAITKNRRKPSTGARERDIRGGTEARRFRNQADAKKTKRDSTKTFNDDSESEGLDKLEGRNPVIEALKADRTINKILIAKGEREGSITQIIALAKQKGIVVQEVERIKLDKLSTTHAHQGVIAFVAVKDYVDVDDILSIAELRGEPPFIVILDEISDAHNLGSVLRTADCVGVHGVIIPKRRAVGLNPAVSKASAGAIEYVPVARVTNISQTIEYLKKKNIWVVGTDATGEKAYFDSDLRGPIALVIGSEGEGMGKLVREKCDFVVNIPMKGKISSLNAAVAGAIIMFEILKQRGT